VTRIELRAAHPDDDLALVHDWMQQPHVIPWWQLAGPATRVRAYLAGQVALAHSDPWIATADGTPFAYVETYRATEDPLAEHYDAHDGDRGWHVLVGPPSFLGSGVPRRLAMDVIVRLLDEPGATRVVCEPDVRNERMLAFCRALGAEPAGELELPGKRAVLMIWTRERVAQW
jgi:acetyl CoA:N6-hydroxylysine acetyl transferase